MGLSLYSLLIYFLIDSFNGKFEILKVKDKKKRRSARWWFTSHCGWSVVGAFFGEKSVEK